MARIPDNAIVASVVVTMTYKLHRHMDRHNPKRHVTKILPLHLQAVGSDAVMKTLPAELQRIGGLVLHDIMRWEGKAQKKPEDQT